MIGNGIAGETAAAAPHAAIGEQQGERVVVSRHRHIRHRTPCLGGGIPNLRREDRASIAEELSAGVSTHDHHFTIRQHDGIGKGACVGHRVRGGDDGRGAVEIDFECRVHDGAVVDGLITTCDDHLARFIHRPGALFRVVSARNLGRGRCHAAAASGVEPANRFKRSKMGQATIGSHEEEGMPIRLDGIGDGRIRHRSPWNAAHAAPSAARVPLLQRAVAIAATVSARGEDLAIWQSHAGVIPAPIDSCASQTSSPTRWCR